MRWQIPGEPVAPRGANHIHRSGRPRDAGGSGRHPAQRVVGERARTKAPDRTVGESALEGGIARRHRRSGPARARRTERIRRRDRGPEAGRVRTHLKERGEPTRPTAGGQRTPERGSDRREENASKREARGRSGAREGARRDGGGRREGGTQTSHAARRGAGRLRGIRVPRSGMCRGARKPREGSIVGRAGPSGSPRRCGGVAMGLCREAKAQGGPEDGAIRPTDPARGSPEGVRTPCGPTEPMSVAASRG